MAVYPFYLEADSSSRKSTISGGVRSKNGYMNTKIYQRDNGEITTPYEIRQYTRENTETGKLQCVTAVYYQGKCVSEHTTDY